MSDQLLEEGAPAPYSLSRLAAEAMRINNSLGDTVHPTASKEFQSSVGRAIQLLRQCQALIQSERVFSANEELSDIDTERLRSLLRKLWICVHDESRCRYVLVEALLGLLTCKVVHENRREILITAKVLALSSRSCMRPCAPVRVCYPLIIGAFRDISRAMQLL